MLSSCCGSACCSLKYHCICMGTVPYWKTCTDKGAKWEQLPGMRCGHGCYVNLPGGNVLETIVTPTLGFSLLKINLVENWVKSEMHRKWKAPEDGNQGCQSPILAFRLKIHFARFFTKLGKHFGAWGIKSAELAVGRYLINKPYSVMVRSGGSSAVCHKLFFQAALPFYQFVFF